MRPYGISIKDRRVMYDYGSDKYNSRGCFNKCTCISCRKRKHKIRIDTARKRPSLITNNIMRSAKKRARQFLKKEISD